MLAIALKLSELQRILNVYERGSKTFNTVKVKRCNKSNNLRKLVQFQKGVSEKIISLYHYPLCVYKLKHNISNIKMGLTHLLKMVFSKYKGSKF